MSGKQSGLHMSACDAQLLNTRNSDCSTSDRAAELWYRRKHLLTKQLRLQENVVDSGALTEQ